MRALTRILLIATAIASLALANLYMAANPVDISGIPPAKRSLDHLTGKASSGGETGTDHIEELTFVQTFSRPLFSPDRRKYQPPKAKPKPKPKKKVAKKKPAKKAVKPPKFRLMGVSIVGTKARALIAGAPEDGPTWLSQGDAILKWTLTEVRDQSVTFTREDMQVTFELYPQSQ